MVHLEGMDGQRCRAACLPMGRAARPEMNRDLRVA